MHEPDPRAPLGPEHALTATGLGCLGLFLSGLVALPLGLALAAALGGDEEIWRLGLALPLQSIAMAAAAAWVASRSAAGVRGGLGLAWPRRLWLVPGILLVGPLSDAVVELLRGALPMLELGSIDTLEEAIRASGPLGGLVMLGAVLAAPLGEELLFRGAVYGGLRARLGPAASIGLSALAFGAWHVDPVHAAGATLLGLWLGWLRRVSGSVWPCVAAHVLNNGLWAALTRWGTAPEVPVWSVAVAGLALLGVVGAVELRASDAEKD